ncbi:MAG: UDP-2,3-diacylglucosamine diphosphatase, partial [Ketobacteraceae bacterium]|nr:UDP-2,3-diacylglucosamine diphosphatase [Ketobacteraceae bacterium]
MTTLFISDLHLQEERPDITRAFFAFLHQKAAHASQLYILGDFLEVWIGDDAITPFQNDIIDALNQLSHTCAIYFMHGNRDFLIGDHFANRANLSLLNDPSVISLNGVSTLLTHGDFLCTADTAYMQFRAMVRDPQWQAAFLAKPLEERIAIARELRDKSQTET